MPPLPDATPMFQCKFCDVAKQRKSNRGSPTSSENFKPGTAHHMDFGFIRGPDNLTDMASSGATQGKHVVEGRRGEECYLLIVDAASREIWTFPLKSKSPPTSLTVSQGGTTKDCIWLHLAPAVSRETRKRAKNVTRQCLLQKHVDKVAIL
jgi:hypothetical protein